MRKTPIFFTILAFLLGFTVLCGCAEKGADGDLEKGNDGVNPSVTPGESTGGDTTEIQWEEKVYWTGTIDEDFDGSSVLLVMDKNVGGPNKIHDKSFFGDIEIESITDLTWFTGSYDNLGIDWEIWRQILWIKLPGDSKENVVNVIRQLEKIDGIRSVGPSHYESPD